MIAIGGAIGTGLFLGSGFAIGFAGPSVLISYVIGAFIALLLMGYLAEMTVAHPTSGSFGAYGKSTSYGQDPIRRAAPAAHRFVSGVNQRRLLPIAQELRIDAQAFF